MVDKSKLAIPLIIFVIAVLVDVLLLVIPGIINNELYKNTNFYFVYISFWLWYGIIALSVLLFSKRFKKNKNDKLASAIIVFEFMVGIVGSGILGDITFKQGSLFIWLYGSIPLITGLIILLLILFNVIKKSILILFQISISPLE